MKKPTMNNSTVVTKLQILSWESLKLSVFIKVFSKTQNSSPAKVFFFSLNAILNGNKWLLCLLDGEHTAPRCASYMVCGYRLPSVPKVVCRRAPAGTAIWISYSYACSAVGLNLRRENHDWVARSKCCGCLLSEGMTQSIPDSERQKHLQCCSHSVK